MPIASAAAAIVFAVYMPAHEPGGRARAALDRPELVVGHRAVRVRADRLEHVLDRDVAPVVVPGQDRAAVEEDRRQVEPARSPSACRAGSCRSRRSSTMPSNRSACITSSTESAMTSRLISDAFMPSWPIAMPSETAIVVNSIGHRAALAHALLRERGELAEVVVAGRDLVPARGHADLRLAEVLLGEPDRAEHRAGGRAFGALGDLPAPGATARLVGPARRADAWTRASNVVRMRAASSAGP